LAEGAMLIQRLLKNNVRDIAFDDAVQIYKNAF
jgi:alcohol dehydrogenase